MPFDTPYIREEIVDYFEAVLKDTKRRVRHLRRLIRFIDNLPDDNFELRRLATCPDLTNDVPDNLEFYFPAAELSIFDGHDGIQCFYQYALMANCGTQR